MITIDNYSFNYHSLSSLIILGDIDREEERWEEVFMVCCSTELGFL